MKGNVIGFDAETNSGAISGYDGHRYEFVTLDWRSHRAPQHGDLVDFAPDGERATQVYLLEPGYVPPSFWEFYFSPRGRISRSQYWLRFFLPVVVIGLILDAIAAATGGAGFKAPQGVFELFVLWPGIAVLIKRIHDRDKSGTLVWALYGPLIPMVVLMIAAFAAMASGRHALAMDLWIAAAVLAVAVMVVIVWFFVEFGCMRGALGANRFGPDPVRRN